MRIAQSMRIGVWLLIGLNLLMALGSIWIFMRMAPAIEVIIDQNELSLQACEEMLASLAMLNHDKTENSALKGRFETALKRAQDNITEKEEPGALESIRNGFSEAFAGNISAQRKTISGIILLGKINRNAMIIADRRAKQFGYAGAWGIVFMAVCVFLAGMFFKRSLSINLIKPLEEINAVISANRNGDTMRRCSGSDLPRDVRSLFNGVNEFLDK
ncbi:MAG: hypothetical protein KKC20_05300 [Proteobacteria bacterium]|nr:hypothetical protein [Pseudomonadota bacterium]